jgi:hypothetical protein
VATRKKRRPFRVGPRNVSKRHEHSHSSIRLNCGHVGEQCTSQLTDRACLFHRRVNQEPQTRETGQAKQQYVQTAISVGATLLGALLGRKTVSTSALGRATTAARGASDAFARIASGDPIGDPESTRRSQVSHYYFEGCRYWTPLSSDPPLGRIFWRRVVNVETGEVEPHYYLAGLAFPAGAG